MTGRGPGVPLWWLRTATVDLVTLHAIASSEHPDGTVVDVVSLRPGYSPPGERIVRARMRPATRQMLGIEVRGAPAGDTAPDLVWHEQVRRDLRPVETHLLAFSRDDVARLAEERSLGAVAPGTVLTAADVARLGLAAVDPVGTARANPATGQVLEVSVDPGYRRRRVGTCLLLAAETCAVARGWPSLWTGGTRTALGEALLVALPWGVRRAHPLTSLAPATTPVGEAAGRLLTRS